jgi:hypothetical protein
MPPNTIISWTSRTFRTIETLLSSTSIARILRTRRFRVRTVPLAFVCPDHTRCCIDWWAHKCAHSWILPAIMKYKSQMYPADWDVVPATTNANEAQHHWTNRQTGTRLTIREAIFS